MLRTTIFILSLAVLTCCDKNDTDPTPTPGDPWPSDSIRTLKSGLNFPWEILWGKDDHIWMTEREGKVSKIDPRTGNVVFSASIPGVVATGEGGLLGMVQHPDFLTNGLFYVVFNYTNAGNYREKLVQMKFAGGTVTTVSTLIENLQAANIHNGSRLIISNETTPRLYMTAGDAGAAGNAQDPASLAGRVLRFNLDGTIPSDNPGATAAWSFGHRNPQGLVMVNGKIYASEHGQNIEDEVNIIEKSRNYGWPNVEGPCNTPAEISFCTANNVKEPIWSSGAATIATAGLDYYDNVRIATWQKSLLMTTLKDESLRILTLSNDGLTVTGQQTVFKGTYGRLRDICISPAGRVYICTSNGGNADRIIEVSKL